MRYISRHQICQPTISTVSLATTARSSFMAEDRGNRTDLRDQENDDDDAAVFSYDSGYVPLQLHIVSYHKTTHNKVFSAITWQQFQLLDS